MGMEVDTGAEAEPASTSDSFRRGWKQAMAGDVQPVEELWDETEEE